MYGHASVGPISLRVEEAMQRKAQQHAANGFDPSWRDDVERGRSDVAWLISSQPDQIAFAQNTSFGLSIAATGIPSSDLARPVRERCGCVRMERRRSHARLAVRQSADQQCGRSRIVGMARSRIERQLSDVGKRLKSLRGDLSVAEQALAQVDYEADEARLRALVSETPLAQKEHEQVRRQVDVNRRNRDELKDEIEKLEMRQDELLDAYNER